jgi:hypothetical protein
MDFLLPMPIRLPSFIFTNWQFLIRAQRSSLELQLVEPSLLSLFIYSEQAFAPFLLFLFV